MRGAAVKRRVHHDPRLHYPFGRRAPKGGLRARVATYLGFAAAPEPVPIVAPPLAKPPPGIEALASAVAELLAAVQEQGDGAATIVSRSADEASGCHLTLDVAPGALADATLPDLAQPLIAATRLLIDRACDAEQRLREMGAELAALHSDLDEARAAAERDPLTGLPNRRALEKALADAVSTAHAARAALTLAFCDIDEFKKINDWNGHALGDRVLRLLSDSLTDGAGEGVFVGRQGGDEFVLLFKGVDADDAGIRVDAIRADLAARLLCLRDGDQPIGTVSFSAGVATLRNDEQGDELLRRADAAHYRAKHAGRNRVEIDRS